jgi:hypothetical protein
MGKLSEKFIQNRWILFIRPSIMIQEDQRNFCAWNATNLVMIFIVSKCHL